MSSPIEADNISHYGGLYGPQVRFPLRSAALRAMADRWAVHSAEQRAAAANIENAIAYARTADGWLGTINNAMGRMGELAVRANDGTLNPSDRSHLQAEFSQMQRLIQSITTGPDALAKFNGIPLFQGYTLNAPNSTFSIQA